MRTESHSRAHRVRFTSADTNSWRGIRIEEVEISGGGEQEFHVPPVDEQRIVLTRSGRRYVESPHGSGWSGAVYSRGAVGMTAPGAPTHLRWRFLTDEPVVELHLHLPGELLRRAAERLAPRARRALPDGLLVVDPVIEHTATALLDAARARTPDLYAESAAEFLAAHLLLRRRPTGGAPETARVERAIEYLRDNLQRQVSLTEIADHVGLSRHHFLRTFKQVTGRTPFVHLRDLRVQEAAQHLRRGDRPITEIAYLCGFSSHSALSTTFRRVMGTTPGAYRSATRDG